jgi:hypothetical protein
VLNGSSNGAELTLATAIETGTQLSTIKKNDPDLAVAALSKMIVGLENYYAIPEGARMSVTAAIEAANLILKKYWYLKFEEILYVFTAAKMGQWGTLFGAGTAGKITPDTLFQWLDKYDKSDERITYHEQKRMNEKKAEAQRQRESLTLQELAREYQEIKAGRESKPGTNNELEERQKMQKAWHDWQLQKLKQYPQPTSVNHEHPQV